MRKKSAFRRSAAFLTESLTALTVAGVALATTFDIARGGLERAVGSLSKAAGMSSERQNWITMILSFGAIGWASRRHRVVGRAVA